MQNSEEEYATEPVPEDKTVGWFKVSMVAAMVAFSLPTFLTGVELAAISSPSEALYIILVGAIILTVIGSISAAIGASTRLSSYMLNRIAFGQRGAAFVNIAFANSLQIDPVMSSFATQLNAGIGGYEGRAIKTGDTIKFAGAETAKPVSTTIQSFANYTGKYVIRYTLAPESSGFSEAQIQQFQQQDA